MGNTNKPALLVSVKGSESVLVKRRKHEKQNNCDAFKFWLMGIN